MNPEASELYNKAKRSKTNFAFNDLCKLAREVGFIFRRQNGSHQIYKYPGNNRIMNFQPDKKNPNKAKPYQVKQLIDFIDDYIK